MLLPQVFIPLFILSAKLNSDGAPFFNSYVVLLIMALFATSNGYVDSRDAMLSRTTLISILLFLLLLGTTPLCA